MKILKLSLFGFFIMPIIFFLGCKDREISNPFDSACPKEIFTPSDFKAEQQGGAVRLSWKQSNTNISGFVISRNENDGTFAEVERVDKSLLQWSDENVVAEKKYGYQLFAYAGENLSNKLIAYCTPVNKTAVITDAVSGITSTSAVFGGSATNDSGLDITGRGVCYSANVNPTTADNKVEMGSGSGSFNLSITGLKTGTTYYARAYAITKQGTTYGSQVTFTTSFLTVSPGSYTLPKESGSRVITVESNTDWQVASNQSWCTLSAGSGKANGTITITVSENKEVPQRIATLIFTGTGVTSQSVNITQSGTEPPALTITPTDQNVTNVAGTTTFAITSNVSWTATVDQTWCTITNTSGTGYATLTVNYEANTTNSQRIATLSVTGLGLASKTATVTQQSPIPTDGLVAWYPFNGNANDESGNGNNGTVSGATLTSDRKGIANKAYSFNGQSSFIKSNPVLPNGNAARTISLWFKTSSSSGYNGWGCNTMLSWGQPSDNMLFSPHVYEGKLIIGFFGGDNDIATGKIVNDGLWHCVGVIYDGTIVNVFFDGKLIVTTNRILNTANSELLIGQRTGQGSQAMDGSIDDIRIYNRALTEAEIQQLYNE